MSPRQSQSPSEESLLCSIAAFVDVLQHHHHHHHSADKSTAKQLSNHVKRTLAVKNLEETEVLSLDLKAVTEGL